MATTVPQKRSHMTGDGSVAHIENARNRLALSRMRMSQSQQQSDEINAQRRTQYQEAHRSDISNQRSRQEVFPKSNPVVLPESGDPVMDSPITSGYSREMEAAIECDTEAVNDTGFPSIWNQPEMGWAQSPQKPLIIYQTNIRAPKRKITVTSDKCSTLLESVVRDAAIVFVNNKLRSLLRFDASIHLHWNGSDLSTLYLRSLYPMTPEEQRVLYATLNSRVVRVDQLPNTVPLGARNGTVRAAIQGGPSGVFSEGVFLPDQVPETDGDIQPIPRSSGTPGPSKICVITRPRDITGTVSILKRNNPPVPIRNNVKVRTITSSLGEDKTSPKIHGEQTVNVGERPQVSCQPFNPAPTEPERCSVPRVMSQVVNRNERSQVPRQPVNPAPTEPRRCSSPRLMGPSVRKKKRPQVSSQPVNPVLTEPERCSARRVMSPVANGSENPWVSRQSVKPEPTESNRCGAPLIMSRSQMKFERGDSPSENSVTQDAPAPEGERTSQVTTTSGAQDEGIAPRDIGPLASQKVPAVRCPPAVRSLPAFRCPPAIRCLPSVRCLDGKIRVCRPGQLLKRPDGAIIRMTDDWKPEVLRPPPSPIGNFPESIVIDSESDQECKKLPQSDAPRKGRRAFVLDSGTDTSSSADSDDEFNMNHTKKKRQRDVLWEPAKAIRLGPPKKNISDRVPRNTQSKNPIQWGEIRKGLQKRIPRILHAPRRVQALKIKDMLPATNPSGSEITHFNCPIEPEILITEEGNNLSENDILRMCQSNSGVDNAPGRPLSLGPMSYQQPQPVQLFESANYVTPDGEIQLDPELYASYIENIISELRTQEESTQDVSTLVADVGSDTISGTTRECESTAISQTVPNGGATQSDGCSREIFYVNIRGDLETVITKDAVLGIAPSVVVLDKLKDIPDGTIRLDGEEGTSSWSQLFEGNPEDLFFDHDMGVINEEMNKPEKIRALVKDPFKVAMDRLSTRSTTPDRNVDNSGPLVLFNPVSRIGDDVRGPESMDF